MSSIPPPPPQKKKEKKWSEKFLQLAEILRSRFGKAPRQ